MAQLANRYAAAIFDLSIERGNINENLENALLIRDVFEEDECRGIITHPRITATEKRNFFDEVFGKHVSTDLMGFLNLTVDKNREEFIVPVLSAFIDLAHEHLRKTTATVVSAVPLREEQITALAALLTRKLNKEVTVEQKLDRGVIGGLFINVDGYYVDRTIRTRLHEMKLSLETMEMPSLPIKGDGK